MTVHEHHYIVFLSPGTFFDEVTKMPVESWNVAEAVREAQIVRDRYDARPYGFYFETRADPVSDERGGTLRVESREVRRSGTYFLGGQLRTLDEVKKKADPKESILRSNMESSCCSIVVETTNGYRATHVFGEKDVLLDARGEVLDLGDSPNHVAYRAECERRSKEAFVAEWGDES